jgi:DNA-binding HxlR family transcriptional regulator
MKKQTPRCTPPTEEDTDVVCLCSIEGIMSIISRKWALLIITTIGNHGTLRYGELEGKMGGISPKTLSDRLKELEKAGLVRRETFSEIPPRVEYSLTKDGLELRNALIPVMKWAIAKDRLKIYTIV